MRFSMRVIKTSANPKELEVSDCRISHVREQHFITGLERHDDSITVEDMQKVVEVEQYLEKLFGIRFHIDIKEYTHVSAKVPR